MNKIAIAFLIFLLFPCTESLSKSVNDSVAKGSAVAFDANGDVFILGSSSLSKFNHSLKKMFSSVSITGTGISIAVDSNDDVFVCGLISSADLSATEGAYDSTYNGGTDVFVLKFDNSLENLLASTYLGGSDDERGGQHPKVSMVIDSSDNVFIAGMTSSQDFPVTQNSYDTSFNGGVEPYFNTDAFVSKLDNDLATLLASTFIGGTSAEFCYSAALDSQDNIYIAGATTSEDYPATAGTSLEGYGYPGIFITRFDNSLGSVIASTFILADVVYPEVNSIAIDSDDNIFVCGTTVTSLSLGYWSVFISKFDKNLSNSSAFKMIGGSGRDKGNFLTIDSNDNVFITGSTTSSDFPVTSGAYDESSNDIFYQIPDAFVSKLDNSLSDVLSSTYLGTSSSEIGTHIAIDSQGNVFVSANYISVFENDLSAKVKPLFSELTGEWIYDGTKEKCKGKKKRKKCFLIKKLEVKNEGDNKSKPFKVKIYGNNIQSPLLKKIRIGKIKAGKSIIRKIYLHWNSSDGIYNFIAVLDAGNKVRELYEDNNNISSFQKNW